MVLHKQEEKKPVDFNVQEKENDNITLSLCCSINTSELLGNQKCLANDFASFCFMQITS